MRVRRCHSRIGVLRPRPRSHRGDTYPVVASGPAEAIGDPYADALLSADHRPNADRGARIDQWSGGERREVLDALTLEDFADCIPHPQMRARQNEKNRPGDMGPRSRLVCSRPTISATNRPVIGARAMPICA